MYSKTSTVGESVRTRAYEFLGVKPSMTTTTQNLRGAVAIEFLNDLRPKKRAWTVTAITPDGPTTTQTFTDLEAAGRFIVRCNDNDGRNVYFTSAITPAISRKPKKSDIIAVAYLHVDADPNKDESPQQFKTRMLAKVRTFEPKPTFIINSGNGLQFLWELDAPVPITSDEIIADIEARNHALAVALGADPSTRNIDRLLRLPDTTNYPNAKKRKDGRQECDGRYHTCNDKAVYPLAVFAAHATDDDDRDEDHHQQRDESGSGYGFRFLRDWKYQGLSYEQARDAIRADQGPAGEWARRSDERQLRRAWEAVRDKAPATHTFDDPDISLLDDRRGELPDFPLDTLDPDLREVVGRLARGAGTAFDHVIVPLLGIASSLIGTTRRVKASTSWTQPFTLWVIVTDYSGGGKTPGIDAVRKPLDQIAEESQGWIDELRRDHEQRVELANAAKAAWKAKLKEAHAQNRSPPKPPTLDDPGPFVAPRLYVVDVTIERLARLLTARPQGMLLIQDELAGWFENMSRYSGGNDKQFWLKCWDGGAFNVERVTSDPITIKNLLVGVVGGLQPDKLDECFAGAADGMYARFLFAWPPRAPLRPLNDDISEVDEDIVEILRRLLQLEKPKGLLRDRIPLSDAARATFEELRKTVYDGSEALDGRARDWWSKIPAHALRLAGTLAFLEWGIHGGPEPNKISADVMRAAGALVLDYFWPHAQAALRQIGLTARHADARRVLRWLKAKGKNSISREEVRRHALSRQRDADATDEILNHLTRAGWLRKQEQRTGGPGRPTVRWRVNPRLQRD